MQSISKQLVNESIQLLEMTQFSVNTQNLVKAMLHFDVTQRITILEALNHPYFLEV
jgi:hypothetical protein